MKYITMLLFLASFNASAFTNIVFKSLNVYDENKVALPKSEIKGYEVTIHTRYKPSVSLFIENVGALSQELVELSDEHHLVCIKAVSFTGLKSASQCVIVDIKPPSKLNAPLVCQN